MELILTIIAFGASAITFGLGVGKFFTKKSALFKVLVTSAIGCFMLGELYELVSLFAFGEINKVFNVGMLGSLGGFLFIFSASFSQMDGLVDDRSKNLMKYRLISLLAPALIFAIYIPILGSDLALKAKLSAALIFISIALASYFSLKHFIIPDVSYGIIASIRLYSLSSLALEILTALQIMSDRLEITALYIATSVLIAAAYPCILITMDRGSKKWTI